jgi:hypothetical protein
MLLSSQHWFCALSGPPISAWKIDRERYRAVPF